MAVISIDRIGDLADRLIARAAAAGIRPERLVIVDPCDPEWVVPWNPFLQPGDPHRVADGFVDAVQRHASSWGVLIDNDLRNIARVLVLNRQSPLEIDRMFTDGAFRARMTQSIEDVWLRGYFEQFELLSKEQRLQRHGAVNNKLQSFVANPRMRRVLCGQRTIDLQRLIDDPSAILLVALRQDQLHGSGNVLGEMIIQALWNAFLARAPIPEDQRVKCTLLLDECQNFTNSCLKEIITEGRRFALRLVFAHQSQAQLEPDLRSIMRNICAIQAIFNVGAVDGREMSGMFVPWSRDEAVDGILRLKVGEAFVVRQGMYPVKVCTPNAGRVDMSLVPDFRRRSMLAHGQRIVDVDREIAARYLESRHAEAADNPRVEVRHVRKPHP